MEEKPTGGYKLPSSGDLFAENRTQSIEWGWDVMYTYSVVASLQASASDCGLKQGSDVFRPLVQLTMIVTLFA